MAKCVCGSRKFETKSGLKQEAGKVIKLVMQVCKQCGKVKILSKEEK